MDDITLYDKNNINSLVIPENKDAKYAYEYLVPMIKNGVKKYIKNIETDLKILKIDDVLLPVNINEREYENSYTSSLYAHYIAYAKEELWELKNPISEFICKIVLDIFGQCFKLFKINKAVYVNNWFLSTNLYLDLTKEQYKRITKFLKENYPDHAIIFRSLNDKLNKNEISNFKDLGYKMLGSRQVYIFDYDKRKKLNSKKRYKLNYDINLIQKGNFKISDINSDEAENVINLYNQLYLNKYSNYNPQFSTEFVSYSFKNNLINFKALYKGEKMYGVIGYYMRNNIMTTPILGYDMSVPQKDALYRMLSAQIILESEAQKCCINMSSGASQFKIQRGSEAVLEYSAILYSHLSVFRKSGYNLLLFVMNKIAIPIMRGKKL